MKDKITKTVRRLVSTAQYESVEFVTTKEREIEYINEADRAAAENDLRVQITQDLVSDINYVMDALGLEEKRVFGKSSRPRPSALD